MSYYEVSAKTGQNINEVFQKLVNEIHQQSSGSFHGGSSGKQVSVLDEAIDKKGRTSLKKFKFDDKNNAGKKKCC